MSASAEAWRNWDNSRLPVKRLMACRGPATAVATVDEALGAAEGSFAPEAVRGCAPTVSTRASRRARLRVTTSPPRGDPIVEAPWFEPLILAVILQLLHAGGESLLDPPGMEGAIAAVSSASTC